MLGPKGTGVLWTRKEIEPLLVGGGMVEDVSAEGFKIKKGHEGFEAGTPHISGGIGLGRAADYLVEADMNEVKAHEDKLAGRLLDGLCEIRGVDVYGSSNTNDRSGIVSFTVRGLAPHDVALMLDHASNIMVRSGHHCCNPSDEAPGPEGRNGQSLPLSVQYERGDRSTSWNSRGHSKDDRLAKKNVQKTTFRAKVRPRKLN